MNFPDENGFSGGDRNRARGASGITVKEAYAEGKNFCFENK